MRLILSTSFFIIFAIGLASGQSKQTDRLEQEIKKLDLAEADAILRKDVAALDKLLAKNFTVNSPGNVLIKDREGVYARIRDGVINYTSFERVPETTLFYGNAIVVMGHETIKQKAPGSGTEQAVRRRYTNVWIKEKGKWLLSARQASIICSD